MSEPFLAEIRIVSFNFAPRGWAFANGQIMPINQNQALFALLGTTYGGNGQTTFALPNLQGRTPIHFNNAFPQGANGGEEAHSLGTAEIPAHTHSLTGIHNPGVSNNPTGKFPGQAPAGLGNTYGPSASATPMAPNALTSAGGSQPHNNMQPYLTLNFVVALQGIFPSRN